MQASQEQVLLTFCPGDYAALPPELIQTDTPSHVAHRGGPSASFLEERRCMRIPWDMRLSCDGTHAALLLDSGLLIADLAATGVSRATKLDAPLCKLPRRRCIAWTKSNDDSPVLMVLDGASTVLALFTSAAEALATIPLPPLNAECVGLLCLEDRAVILVYTDSTVLFIRLSHDCRRAEFIEKTGRALADASLECELCLYLHQKQTLLLVAHPKGCQPFANSTEQSLLLCSVGLRLRGDSLQHSQISSVHITRFWTELNSARGAESWMEQLTTMWSRANTARYYLFPVLDVAVSPDEDSILLVHANGKLSAFTLSMDGHVQVSSFSMAMDGREGDSTIRSAFFLDSGLVATLSFDGKLAVYTLHSPQSSDGAPVALVSANVHALPPPLGLQRAQWVPCREQLVVLRYIDQCTYNFFTISRVSPADCILRHLRRRNLPEAMDVARTVGMSEEAVYQLLWAHRPEGVDPVEVLRSIRDDTFVVRAALASVGPLEAEEPIVAEGLARAASVEPSHSLAGQGKYWLTRRRRKLVCLRAMLQKASEGPLLAGATHASVDTVDVTGSGDLALPDVLSKSIQARLDQSILRAAASVREGLAVHQLADALREALDPQSALQQRGDWELLHHAPLEELVGLCARKAWTSELLLFLRTFPEDMAAMLAQLDWIPTVVDPLDYLAPLHALLCDVAAVSDNDDEDEDGAGQIEADWYSSSEWAEWREWYAFSSSEATGERLALADCHLQFLRRRMATLVAEGQVFHALATVDHALDALRPGPSTATCCPDVGDFQALHVALSRFCLLLYHRSLPSTAQFLDWTLATSADDKIAMCVSALLKSPSCDEQGVVQCLLTLQAVVCEDEANYQRIADWMPRRLHAHVCMGQQRFEERLTDAILAVLQSRHIDIIAAMVALRVEAPSPHGQVLVASPLLLSRLLVLVLTLCEMSVAVSHLSHVQALGGLLSTESVRGQEDDPFVQLARELEMPLLCGHAVQHYLGEAPPLELLCPTLLDVLKASAHSAEAGARSADLEQVLGGSARVRHYRYKRHLAESCGALGQEVLDHLHTDGLLPSLDLAASLHENLMRVLDFPELLLLKICSVFLDRTSDDFEDYRLWLRLTDHLLILSSSACFRNRSAKPRLHSAHFVPRLILLCFVQQASGEFLRNFVLFFLFGVRDDVASSSPSSSPSSSTDCMPPFANNLRALGVTSEEFCAVVLWKLRDWQSLGTDPSPSDLEVSDCILDTLVSAQGEGAQPAIAQALALEKNFVALLRFLQSHGLTFHAPTLRLLSPAEMHDALYQENATALYRAMLGLPSRTASSRENSFLSLSAVNQYLMLLSSCSPDTSLSFSVEVSILLKSATAAIVAQDGANLYLLLRILHSNYNVASIDDNDNLLRVLITAIHFLHQQAISDAAAAELRKYASDLTGQPALATSTTLWQELYGLYLSACADIRLPTIMTNHHAMLERHRSPDDDRLDSLNKGMNAIHCAISAGMHQYDMEGKGPGLFLDSESYLHEAVCYFALIAEPPDEVVKKVARKLHKLSFELEQRLQEVVGREAEEEEGEGKGEEDGKGRWTAASTGGPSLPSDHDASVLVRLQAIGYSEFVARRSLRLAKQAKKAPCGSESELYGLALQYAIEDSSSQGADHPVIYRTAGNRPLFEQEQSTASRTRAGLRNAVRMVRRVHPLLLAALGLANSSAEEKEEQKVKKKEERTEVAMGPAPLATPLSVASPPPAELPPAADLATQGSLDSLGDGDLAAQPPRRKPRLAAEKKPARGKLRSMGAVRIKDTEDSQSSQAADSPTEASVIGEARSVDSQHREREPGELARPSPPIAGLPLAQSCAQGGPSPHEGSEQLARDMASAAEWSGMVLSWHEVAEQLAAFQHEGAPSTREATEREECCVETVYKVSVALALDPRSEAGPSEGSDAWEFLSSRVLGGVEAMPRLAAALSERVEARHFPALEGDSASRVVPHEILLREYLGKMDGTPVKLRFLFAAVGFEAAVREGHKGTQFWDALQAAPLSFLVLLHRMYSLTDDRQLRSLIAMKEAARDLLAQPALPWSAETSSTTSLHEILRPLYEDTLETDFQSTASARLSEDLRALELVERHALPSRQSTMLPSSSYKLLIQSPQLFRLRGKDGMRMQALTELLPLLTSSNAMHWQAALAAHLSLTKGEAHFLVAMHLLSDCSSASSPPVVGAVDRLREGILEAVRHMDDCRLQALVLCALGNLDPPKSILQEALAAWPIARSHLSVSLPIAERLHLMAAIEAQARGHKGKERPSDGSHAATTLEDCLKAGRDVLLPLASWLVDLLRDMAAVQHSLPEASWAGRAYSDAQATADLLHTWAFDRRCSREAVQKLVAILAAQQTFLGARASFSPADRILSQIAQVLSSPEEEAVRDLLAKSAVLLGGPVPPHLLDAALHTLDEAVRRTDDVHSLRARLAQTRCFLDETGTQPSRGLWEDLLFGQAVKLHALPILPAERRQALHAFCAVVDRPADQREEGGWRSQQDVDALFDSLLDSPVFADPHGAAKAAGALCALYQLLAAHRVGASLCAQNPFAECAGGFRRLSADCLIAGPPSHAEDGSRSLLERYWMRCCAMGVSAAAQHTAQPKRPACLPSLEVTTKVCGQLAQASRAEEVCWILFYVLPAAAMIAGSPSPPEWVPRFPLEIDQLHGIAASHRGDSLVHEALAIVTTPGSAADLEALASRLCSLLRDESTFTTSSRSRSMVAAMAALCAGPTLVEQCLVRQHGGRGARLLQSLGATDLDDVSSDWSETTPSLVLPCHASPELIAAVACSLGLLQEASWFWWMARHYNVKLFDCKLALRSLRKALLSLPSEWDTSASTRHFVLDMSERLSRLLLTC